MGTSPNSPIQLEYHLVDVFTATPLQGNGLAVVFDSVGLSTDRMQSIAREFNLSETTFIQRRDPPNSLTTTPSASP
jgi:trans-2,3-dihydro-3-hydroxyanthranilate isomerase